MVIFGDMLNERLAVIRRSFESVCFLQEKLLPIVVRCREHAFAVFAEQLSVIHANGCSLGVLVGRDNDWSLSVAIKLLAERLRDDVSVYEFLKLAASLAGNSVGVWHGVFLMPNVRAKRATTAGRQGPD